MINVLIVDDSLTTREYISYIIDQDPELRLVGAARNGQEAIQLVASASPDVVIMDIHMPGMDGYKATRTIMETRPVPIIIHSSLVAPEQTKNIFNAMEAGAVAVAQKPPGIGNPETKPFMEKLLRTVKLMAEVKVVRRRPARPKKQSPESPARILQATDLTGIEVIAIGASTGGPPVLHQIFRELPPDFPVPIAVVQHITTGFLPGMLRWLGGDSRLDLKIARTGDSLAPGHVYFAPEESNMGISDNGRILVTKFGGQKELKRPVTHLFMSVAQRCGARAVGILLTGMGDDGALGLKEMKRRGAQTLVQDRETATVFGMPESAIKLDAANYILSPPEISDFLNGLSARGPQKAKPSASVQLIDTDKNF